MRDTMRMEGDGTRFDPSATPELSSNIVQDFIGFDVAVSIRDFDRLGVRIQHSRSKGTDYKTGRLKGLMDRRRLMDRAGDRLKVVRIEGKGIHHAIPTHDIKRMIGECVLRPTIIVVDP